MPIRMEICCVSDAPSVFMAPMMSLSNQESDCLNWCIVLDTGKAEREREARKEDRLSQQRLHIQVIECSVAPICSVLII